jgi:hypothetical protein
MFIIQIQDIILVSISFSILVTKRAGKRLQTAIVSFFVSVASRNNLSLAKRILVKVYNRNSFLLKPVITISFG